MSSSSFLLIPVDDKQYVILPKGSIRKVTEDEKGVCIEYRIGSSIGWVRPPSNVRIGNVAEALKATTVLREMG